MKIISAFLVTAVAVGSTWAQAQPNQDTPPYPPPPPPPPGYYAQPQYVQPQPVYVVPPPEHHHRGYSLDLMLQADAMHYTGDVSDEINYGPGYGLILGINPTRMMGLEASYQGGVNGISSTFSTNGLLVTNQIGGDLRVNVVPPRHDFPLHIRPFAFGGVAYHNVSAENFTPGITSAGGTAIPVGGGIDATIAGLLIGGRFTYNWIYDEMDNFSGHRADYWTAGLNLGARFW